MIKETEYVEDLLVKYPRLASLLQTWDIVCIQCGEPVWGTLGDLIRDKGLDVQQITVEINREFGAGSAG